MNDDKPPVPMPEKPSGRYAGPEKPTIDMPREKVLEGLLRSMQQQVQEGFAGVNADIGRLKEDVSKTHDDVNKMKGDIHLIYVERHLDRDRIAHLEQRLAKTSGNMRAVNASDEEQYRTLAAETEKRKALEAEIRRLTNEVTKANEKLASAESTAEETKTIAEAAKSTAEETKTIAADTKALTQAQSAELAAQTATLNRLAQIAANPVVKELAKTIATAATTAIATWAALR